MTQDTERAQASLRTNKAERDLRSARLSSPVETVVEGARIHRHLLLPEVDLIVHQAVHHSQTSHGGQNLHTLMRGS